METIVALISLFRQRRNVHLCEVAGAHLHIISYSLPFPSRISSRLNSVFTGRNQLHWRTLPRLDCSAAPVDHLKIVVAPGPGNGKPNAATELKSSCSTA